MTFREKKRRYERDTRILIRLGTQAPMGIWLGCLFGVLTDAGPWYWEMLFQRGGLALFSGLILIILIGVYEIRIPYLDFWMRWKMEIFDRFMP